MKPVGPQCPSWALLTPLWLHQATTSNMGMVDGGSWPSPSPIGRPAGGGAGSPPEVSRKLPRTCQPIVHPRAVQSHGTMARLEHLLVSLCAGTDWHDCGHMTYNVAGLCCKPCLMLWPHCYCCCHLGCYMCCPPCTAAPRLSAHGLGGPGDNATPVGFGGGEGCYRPPGIVVAVAHCDTRHVSMHVL